MVGDIRSRTGHVGEYLAVSQLCFPCCRIQIWREKSIREGKEHKQTARFCVLSHLKDVKREVDEAVHPTTNLTSATKPFWQFACGEFSAEQGNFV